MKWLKDSDLDEFINVHNYDIRLTKNARWIDQKCTPDVITIISDCILEFLESKNVSEIENVEFTSMDIWRSEYAIENVLNIFKKPNPNAAIARNEYDKFFQQPMELLSYSGVLNKIKKGARNFYKVKSLEMLEYLALRERNCLHFLSKYIEKVLKDSEIFSSFSNFFVKQDKESFTYMKERFIEFTVSNTNINKRLEPSRIFTKVLNPLSYIYNKHGSEKGHMSKDIISYDMLMYNRDNFRDLYSDKPKGMTRKEFAELHNINNKGNQQYFKYLVVKAKRIVRIYNRDFNSSLSELYQENSRNEIATHMHHIFPEATFPKIAYYMENIIALTPTQHLNYAHPLNNTSMINRDYQYLCLIAKTDTIKHSYDFDLGVYDFYKFMIVLRTGLDEEKYLSIEHLDFDNVIKQINISYER